MRAIRAAIAGLTIAAVATLATWTTTAALDCEGILVDDGCLFTITGGDTPEPEDGYAVTNADGVPLYDFVRERDLQAIGYPISQRWVNGPFTLQAFQKVILQWDPGKQRMNYYNTLDVLANRYPDVELPNVPAHEVLEADQGADFATITRNHLALLDQNPRIKERFLGEPDWLNLYGLPIRYEEREAGDHPRGLQMLRAQRTVFVIWNVPAPGTTVGRVNLQNVPDKVKKLSNVIIPDAAKAPVTRDAAADLPLFTLPVSTPTSTPAPTAPPAPRPDWLPQWQVLIDLYHATDGQNWTNNSNWLSGTSVSKWHGVTTAGGRITELRLWNNNLNGEIPWELGYLTSLRSLDLSENQLRGEIPPELGRLANLKWLTIEKNQLSGPIPPELGLLVDLRSLFLYGNRLQGAIPPELGNLSNLRSLGLGDNQLTGGIPHALGRLAMLDYLDLQDNRLTGSIPSELGRLTKLVLATLQDNQLSGELPAELGNLASLWMLALDNNQLSGAIPPALGRLASLRWLYLSDNQLRGAIPSELGSLANLEYLFLGGSNQFTGCIPYGLRNIERSDVGALGLPFC